MQKIIDNIDAAVRDGNADAARKSKGSHVWYSPKQFESMQERGDGVLYAILENGVAVVYTELTETKEMPFGWDDYVYLGRGVWHEFASK